LGCAMVGPGKSFFGGASFEAECPDLFPDIFSFKRHGENGPVIAMLCVVCSLTDPGMAKMAPSWGARVALP